MPFEICQGSKAIEHVATPRTIVSRWITLRSIDVPGDSGTVAKAREFIGDDDQQAIGIGSPEGDE